MFQPRLHALRATGLAVPSIWTGGLLLHKQYVTPFAPMNTLAKLLAAEDYRRWISMEHIVETITAAERRARAARCRCARSRTIACARRWTKSGAGSIG